MKGLPPTRTVPVGCPRQLWTTLPRAKIQSPLILRCELWIRTIGSIDCTGPRAYNHGSCSSAEVCDDPPHEEDRLGPPAGQLHGMRSSARHSEPTHHVDEKLRRMWPWSSLLDAINARATVMRHPEPSRRLHSCSARLAAFAVLAVAATACKADKERRKATETICAKMSQCREDIEREPLDECAGYFYSNRWTRNDAVECLSCLNALTCEELVDGVRPHCRDQCPMRVFPPPGDEAPVANIEAAKREPCSATVPIAGRSMPRYVGMPGWLRADPGERPEQTPWMLRALRQTGPEAWEPDPKSALHHKTPVTVVEQWLKHEGHGAYSGRLRVRVMGTTDEAVIGNRSFSLTPYWECPDALSPSPHGPVLAEVSRATKSIDRQGRWQDARKGTVLLCDGHVSPPKGAEAFALCRGVREKYGSLYFDPADVAVTY